MKIAVLAGGTSTERAVSVVSGTMVTKALREKGHRAVLIDVFAGDARLAMPAGGDADTDAWFPEEYDTDEAAAYIHSFDDKITDMRRQRRADREGFFGPGVLRLCRAADIVFLALHGMNGEDGRIQGTFDLLDIPYTGCGSLGSALAMDKALSKMMFRKDGVSTPAGILLRKEELEHAKTEHAGSADARKETERASADDASDPAGALPGLDRVVLPVVVKPCCGGSSVGVSIARTREEYLEALRVGFSYEDTLIVEQYVEGREFSVGIVDGEVYPVIEIAPIEGFYDYTNKYKAGATVETCPAALPPDLTAKMQREALRAYQSLHLNGYGRIDIMMDRNDNIYCLEANTLPGMTPTSLLPQEAAVLGMDFGALCEKLIDISLRERGAED